MKLSLKAARASSEWQQETVQIKSRLPGHIAEEALLACDYIVYPIDDYYLLSLKVAGTLAITCQRCLDTFSHEYRHAAELAICRDDEMAERLMTQYECVIATTHLDLKELLTDDLHLITPDKHDDVQDCNEEIANLCGQDLDCH